MIDLVYLQNKHHVYPNANYLDVLQQHADKIDLLGINYNRPHNPIYMHTMLCSLFYLFSNPTFWDLNLPKDDHLLCVIGLIAQHHFDPTEMWDTLLSGSYIEKHYKLWRYFFTTILFVNSWNEIEKFVMFCVDFSFYLDQPFQRNILLMSFYDFLLCGMRHGFDFSLALSIMRAQSKDFFQHLTKSLLWLEALKISMVRKEPFTHIPEEAFSMTAARLRIKPEYLGEFIACLRKQQYQAAEERAFFQPIDQHQYMVM